MPFDENACWLLFWKHLRADKRNPHLNPTSSSVSPCVSLLKGDSQNRMGYVSASWLHETAAVHKRDTSEESWPPNGGWAASTSLIQSLSQYAIGSLKFFALFLFSCIRSCHQKHFNTHIICNEHMNNHSSSVLWWDIRVEGHWRIGTLNQTCQKPTLGHLALPQDHVYRFLEGRFAKTICQVLFIDFLSSLR